MKLLADARRRDRARDAGRLRRVAAARRRGLRRPADHRVGDARPSGGRRRHRPRRGVSRAAASRESATDVALVAMARAAAGDPPGRPAAAPARAPAREARERDDLDDPGAAAGGRAGAAALVAGAPRRAAPAPAAGRGSRRRRPTRTTRPRRSRRCARPACAARPIDRAVAFLRRHQNRDGGFELTLGRGSDAQSTAWAIQALLAAGASRARPRSATCAAPAPGRQLPLQRPLRLDAALGDRAGAARARPPTLSAPMTARPVALAVERRQGFRLSRSRALRRDGTSVAALLTTFTDDYDRVSMHGVRRGLVRTQAAGGRTCRWSRLGSRPRATTRPTPRGWKLRLARHRSRIWTRWRPATCSSRTSAPIGRSRLARRRQIGALPALGTGHRRRSLHRSSKTASRRTSSASTRGRLDASFAGRALRHRLPRRSAAGDRPLRGERRVSLVRPRLTHASTTTFACRCR